MTKVSHSWEFSQVKWNQTIKKLFMQLCIKQFSSHYIKIWNQLESISFWLDKENVVHTHSQILSHTKEWDTVLCNQKMQLEIIMLYRKRRSQKTNTACILWYVEVNTEKISAGMKWSFWYMIIFFDPFLYYCRTVVFLPFASCIVWLAYDYRVK